MSVDNESLIVGLAESAEALYFGKYRGIVREVGEGDDLGFIRAEIPELFGDQLSPWATPSVPFAGRDHGWITIPEEGDGVWIEFEGGMLSHPIWSGFWWAEGEMPELSGPLVRVLATTLGHKLVLDDDQNQVRIEHADGPSIEMTDSSIKLTVGGKSIEITDASVKINGANLEVK